VYSHITVVQLRCMRPKVSAARLSPRECTSAAIMAAWAIPTTPRLFGGTIP